MQFIHFCFAITLTLLNAMIDWINLVSKYHKRKICKLRGHIIQDGNTIFGLWEPKYRFTCKRCGKRSEEDSDSIKKVFGDSDNNRWTL